MPLLFGVRLPLKNKAILVSVFLIGAFTYKYPRLTYKHITNR